MLETHDENWWRGGVIYQIYPRSFADSNGDGIGDLAGITSRLDYVASLGVDAIWISPFFMSPMKDFGYDVSDYCDVDPMFGVLADFDALVQRAHELGLKVMIDQVLSHSSDQHDWFVESRSSRENPKADWYVWAEAKEDGSPPNNWLSVFGNSAWQWDTRRRQYYLHNFLVSQPDLNFHHPEVQDALLATVRFWLERGVDGYRLDTSNFYFHDAQLRDNPARGRPTPDRVLTNSVNPYAWQWHKYDKSQPENLGFLRRLRAFLNEFPATAMVGEIDDDDGLARLAEYTGGGDKLHMAYCFDLMSTAHSARFLNTLFTRFEALSNGGWPCWALSNHDVVRVATRWGSSDRGGDASQRLLRLAAAMQMSLRGTPCIYQGDELGLPEVALAYEDLKDPYGLAMWPEFKGRDGCRTPMAWSHDADDLGFSTGEGAKHSPWLPVAETHRALAVDRQRDASDSLLAYYRTLLRWRRTQPALIGGAMRMLDPDDDVLAYVRSSSVQAVLCVFNFSDKSLSWRIPEGLKVAEILSGSGLDGAQREGESVRLTPWGGFFAALAD